MIEKLSDLGAHMPGCDKFTCEYGAYLAGRLNPTIVPEGFTVAAELALSDLQTGVNGFTREPIRNSLVGQPPQVYAILSMYTPKIAEAVCPEDFAKRVRELHDEIYD